MKTLGFILALCPKLYSILIRRRTLGCVIGILLLLLVVSKMSTCSDCVELWESRGYEAISVGETCYHKVSALDWIPDDYYGPQATGLPGIRFSEPLER